MKVEPGIYENLSPRDYYSVGPGEAVSQSLVSSFAEEWTPYHFYRKFICTDAPERPFNINFYHGSLFHKLCEMGEESFLASHIMIPRSVRKGSDPYRELLTRNPGKKPVREVDLAPILSMYRSMTARDSCKDIQKTAKHEVSIFWEYRGYLLKARIDFLLPGIVGDFKSTRNANPYRKDGFQKSITDYRYHWQLFFYCWGMQVLTGRSHRAAIVAVEKDFPNLAANFELTKEQLAEARYQMMPKLDELIDRLQSGDWGRGYGESFHTPDSLNVENRVSINDLIRRVS